MNEVELNMNAEDFEEYTFQGNAIKKEVVDTPQKEDDVLSQSALTDADANCGFYEGEFLLVDEELLQLQQADGDNQ